MLLETAVDLLSKMWECMGDTPSTVLTNGAPAVMRNVFRTDLKFGSRQKMDLPRREQHLTNSCNRFITLKSSVGHIHEYRTDPGHFI